MLHTSSSTASVVTASAATATTAGASTTVASVLASVFIGAMSFSTEDITRGGAQFQNCVLTTFFRVGRRGYDHDLRSGRPYNVQALPVSRTDESELECVECH